MNPFRLLVLAAFLFPLPLLAWDQPFAPFAPDSGARFQEVCGHHDPKNELCADIVGMVRRRGAVALRDNFGKCQRVVMDQGSCPGQDYLEALWVETRDDYECLAGYVCRHEAR